MKKLTLILAFLYIFAGSSVIAQKVSLKGTITDTLNKQNLSNAVISVLRAKDSVLVKFARTDAQGNFEMKGLSAGNFILMISYPTYADYVEKIIIEPGKDLVFGSLPLITKAKLLEEVIVRQRIGSTRMKGDTMEYKADSFHVSANADVQELLRKMPGVQVNSKGEITERGEKVEKILVDGEEFFSDDPAVVTKNLRADAVDKIQTFDKKSDQAVFSGIDDGTKIKTMNIQLKEDKKKGYFGKVEAGTDFDHYRYGKLLANAFKGKRKIAGYITTDNTKFESLNWDESRNYAGGDGGMTITDDGGGIMIFGGGGDDFSYGRGFPNSVTGGFHFSNKWDKDKYNSNNTYQYNNLDVTSTTNSVNKTILPSGDTSFTSTTNQQQVGQRSRHKLTSIYEWQIDSSSSIKFTVRPSAVKSFTKTNYIGKSMGLGNIPINETDRNTTTNDQNNTLNTNIFWRKKFVKKGRTISLNADLNFNDHTENTMLLSANSYFNPSGTLASFDNVDQMKANKQTTSTINSLLTYTEPLWKNTFLVLNYRFNLNRNDAERNTFGKDNTGKYANLVDTLSNHFIFNTTGQLGSFNVRYTVKKVNFAVGTGVGSSVYHMTDIYKNTNREVTFNNFVPSVSFVYTPKQQRRVTFNYNGNTRNPTLAQIQPILDNIDPNNITIGNPNLKQSFTHSFNFRASDYKVLKNRSISLSVNYSATEHAITNSSTVDNFARRVSQAINVDGNYNANMYVSYGFDLFHAFNIGVNVGPGKSRNSNVINNIFNTTNTTSANIGMYASYNSDKWINFWLNLNANYNKSVSSVRPDDVTQYWSYSSYSNAQLKFAKAKTYIDLTLETRIYQKVSVFANQKNAYILSPSIRKVISKDDKWEAKVVVNDLFNQNSSVNSNINSNFISVTTNETIQRYFLVSLIYNFSKNGKPTTGF